VSDHPWPAVVGSVVVLAAMAVPVLDLHLGQTDTSAMPEETQVRQSYDLMTDGFGEGSNGPMLVVSSLDPKAQNDQKQLDELNAEVEKQQAQQEQAVQDLVLQGVPPEEAQAQVAAEADEDKQAETEQKQDFLASPASDPRLQDLRTAMEKQDGVGSVSQPMVNDSGDAALYSLVPAQAPAERKTEDAVSALRDDVIPKTTEGDGMEVHVGGRTAGFIDLAQKIADKLMFVILLVVALSFVVLMFAFRSVVVPLKAGLMNLLSVAAAFGVVTLIFQEGFMVEAIGLEEAIPIVSFVPLIMFAILFGLSMDYEVFLMTHVQERYLKTKDNRDAVIHGIATTGRLITSAALIMVAVFGSFILSGDPQVKQFGVGLSVAIAVDATIVRCLLVPAIMTLLGDRNWYMPGWLDRHTPKISIEGDEYFAQRDAGR
jgi:RND superfamily putative drug exporter